MGPALTHVSMKYGDSGWKHVTAEEAKALFPKQSVPAGTRQFICECCGQYVSFTKDGINVRHFKHSRGEEDKTCEERVARNAECEIVQYNTYDFPLRLALYDTDLNLSIGIPQCAIKTKDIKVTVQGKREGGHEYTIRNEAASGLVWLDLNKDIANSYKIKTESRYPNWPEIIAGINPAGTFFDSYGGRRLHEGDEVYAEHDYYMLRKGFEYGRPSMNTNEVLKIGLNGDIWRVYKVRVRSITYDTTAFFLPFSLNLVKDPIDMKVLWPPVVNVDETYYHDSNEVYIAHNCPDNKISLQMLPKFTDEKSDGSCSFFKAKTKEFQQMAATFQNNNMRECGYHLMLWKHGFAKKRIDADVVISDTEGNVIEESSIKKFPKNRTLLVSVCYDGQIIIRQDSQTKEIIPIKNGEQKKIHVDSDSEIIVTQGCDAVRTLSVDVQEKVHGISVFSKKPARVNYLYGKVASNSYMTEKEKAAMRKSIYAGEFPVKSLRSVTHFGAK